MYRRQRTTLKASESGKIKINQARKKKGWTVEDDRWLEEAIVIISRNGVRGASVALATWKRFLQAKLRIEAETFKAFCQVLDLHWEDVAEDAVDSSRDLSEAPSVSSFYGRTTELVELERWFIQERCRLIVIHGMGGIGKSSLARQLVEKIADKYDYVIWRSLNYEPSFPRILTEIVQFLSQEQKYESNISQLMQYFKQYKCLLVLDDWEEITTNQSEDYSNYCNFFKRIAKECHQSCVLLIGRERPQNIELLNEQLVRLKRLGDLTSEEAKEILKAEGLSGTADKLEEFSQRYRNPWVLKRIARMVHTVFEGEISDFVENTSIYVDNAITEFLDNQFQNLSELEKNIIYWIAIRRNTASWHQLVKDKAKFLTYDQLFHSLNFLIQVRSLVNKNLEEAPILYILDLVILKYTTNRFVEETFQQIVRVIKSQILHGDELFVSHSFVTENAEEKLTQEQVRRIIKPIQEKLLAKLQSQQRVEEELRKILSLLENKGLSQGYECQNILSLLS